MNSFYADGFSITVGLVDAKVDFLISVPNVTEEGIVSGEKQILGQRVVMTLPLAKELSEKLSGIIKTYEGDFGVISNLTELQEKASAKGK